MRKLENYTPTKFMAETSHYDASKADFAVNFIQNLRHTKGRWAGKPFELIDWQEQIVRDLFGIVKPNGYRQFNTAYIEIPKKCGKALALDTPVPTPSGWKTMGTLKVGDSVFDETGSPCKIVKTTDIMRGHKCYCLEFFNGEQIIADAEHQWLTTAWIDRPGAKKMNTRVSSSTRQYRGSIARIRTTEEIANSLLCNRGTTHNHSITLAEPLQYTEKELPIPPYTFGAWLGDGSSHNARLTNHIDDFGIVERIRTEGVPARLYPSSKKAGTETYDYSLSTGWGSRHDGTTIQEKLKKLGVLKNKHIPDIYLQASIHQRTELLRGLMDTDGYCSRAGQCEFTTTSEKLKDGVLELLSSLGIKATYGAKISTYNGKKCGTKYRIRFHGNKETPCFTLPRKVERLKEKSKKTRASVVHIVSAKEIASVPVRCIQVDSKSHMYLVGRSMIPTHNSELAAAVANYLSFGDDEMGAEIYGCAADRQQASIVFNVAADMIRMCPFLYQNSKILDASKRIMVPETSSFYQVLSAEAPTKHGFNVHGVIFDELHAQPNRNLFDVMTKGSGDARTQPLYFLITTAGNDTNSICYEIHQKALDIIEGRKVDPTFYPVIYGAAENEDWTSPKVWAKANPSLGITIDIEKVKAAYESAKQNPAEENSFRQLRLNQWVKQESRWLSVRKWDECKVDFDEADLEGRICYGGLDLSSTTDLTAFVLTFPPIDDDDKYFVLPYFWLPEETIDLRSRRDHVPYDTWQRLGLLNVTEGNVVDYAAIEKFIAELADRYRIAEIAFDRWNATYLTQRLEGEYDFTMVQFGQGFSSMSAPTKELERLILERRLAHNGHEVLRWNVDNLVVETDAAGNIKPSKRKATEKIDGVVALIMSLARATINGASQASVYDERGLLFI